MIKFLNSYWMHFLVLKLDNLNSNFRLSKIAAKITFDFCNVFVLYGFFCRSDWLCSRCDCLHNNSCLGNWSGLRWWCECHTYSHLHRPIIVPSLGTSGGGCPISSILLHIHCSGGCYSLHKSECMSVWVCIHIFHALQQLVAKRHPQSVAHSSLTESSPLLNEQTLDNSELVVQISASLREGMEETNKDKKLTLLGLTWVRDTSTSYIPSHSSTNTHTHTLCTSPVVLILLWRYSGSWSYLLVYFAGCQYLLVTMYVCSQYTLFLLSDNVLLTVFLYVYAHM